MAALATRFYHCQSYSLSARPTGNTPSFLLCQPREIVKKPDPQCFCPLPFLTTKRAAEPQTKHTQRSGQPGNWLLLSQPPFGGTFASRRLAQLLINKYFSPTSNSKIQQPQVRVPKESWTSRTMGIQNTNPKSQSDAATSLNLPNSLCPQICILTGSNFEAEQAD